jgi:hypothetical protein
MVNLITKIQNNFFVVIKTTWLFFIQAPAAILYITKIFIEKKRRGGKEETGTPPLRCPREYGSDSSRLIYRIMMGIYINIILVYIYNSLIYIFEFNENFKNLYNYSLVSNYLVLRIENLRVLLLKNKTQYEIKFDFYNMQFVKIRTIIKNLFLETFDEKYYNYLFNTNKNIDFSGEEIPSNISLIINNSSYLDINLLQKLIDIRKEELLMEFFFKTNDCWHHAIMAIFDFI